MSSEGTSDPVDCVAEQLDQIRANAQKVVDTLDPLTDFAFGYDGQSLEYLDGYLDRQRQRPEGPPDIATVVGCYVGEAIIATYGGEWIREEKLGLGVKVQGITASPFNKVTKMLDEGLEGGQSVSSFVRAVAAIIKQSDE